MLVRLAGTTTCGIARSTIHLARSSIVVRTATLSRSSVPITSSMCMMTTSSSSIHRPFGAWTTIPKHKRHRSISPLSGSTSYAPHVSFVRSLSTSGTPTPSSTSNSSAAPTPSNGNDDNKKDALWAALWPSLPIGIASGYVGTITGVGGALLMIPLLVGIARVKHIEANGTAVFTTLGKKSIFPSLIFRF
jgi:hypothetical protein